MAQTVSERLRASGTLTASDWATLPERMIWKMERINEALQADPNRALEDIGYGDESSLAYDYGTWTHAYLSDMSALDVLLDTFYASLNNLNWEESFFRAYGMSSDRFISEFRQFLNLPIAEQLLILPTN